eukprot:SAG31_NODE_1554_length_7897_cov_13.662221_4_plen_580_part_00
MNSFAFVWPGVTRLSGTIPDSLGLNIVLQLTRISGTIPNSVCSRDLTQLTLNGCFIAASNDLSDCNKLLTVDISNNSITSLPSFPSSVTHLYLGTNPLNVTSSELKQLAQSLPQLKALDIGFLGLEVEFSATQIRLPTNCRLGPNPPRCVVELQLFDSQFMPVMIGGMKKNLTLGTDCVLFEETYFSNAIHRVFDSRGTRLDGTLHVQASKNCGWVSKPMHDKGHGWYDVELPAQSGPNVSEFRRFALFDNGVEFFPTTSATSSNFASDYLLGAPSLRTVHYKQAICPQGSHTVPGGRLKATCVCKLGYETDGDAKLSDFNNMVRGCHKSCPGAGEEPDKSGLVCTCQPGWYNATAAGALTCVASGGYRPSLSAPAPPPTGSHCRECPRGCTDCDRIAGGGGGDSIGPSIAGGWRLNSSSSNTLLPQLSNAGGPSPKMQLIFRCPSRSNSELSNSCPHITLPSGEEDLTINGTASGLCCNKPFVGILCGACASGYRLRGRDCEECIDFNDLTTNDFGMSPYAIFGVTALALVLICTMVYVLRGGLARLKNEVFINFKIVSMRLCHNTHLVLPERLDLAS